MNPSDLVAIGEADLLADRYRILERLGEGQFGEVWRAEDSTTGRIVALKLIDPSESTPDAAWAEATRLTSLESPHIVRVHGAAMTLDVPYLDMALAPGGNAAKASSPFGTHPSTAVRWALQACRGLQLSHVRGIVHRDVKPHNILLNGAGDALLGDFGVAAILGPDGTATAHGDRQICAPEVFVHERTSPSTDVYSLGVTLYYFLTGNYPHRLQDHRVLETFVEAVSAGCPDIRDVAPHVSSRLAKVVRRGIAVDPDHRFATATEFADALSRVPGQRRPIRRIPPHVGHEMCWEIAEPLSGPGVAASVCASPSGRRRTEVVTKYLISGRRIEECCAVLPNGKVASHLRTTFDWFS